MSYTRKDIPELIKLFETVRWRIQGGYNMYLCTAIRSSVLAEEDIRRKAEKLVMEALGSKAGFGATLECWLEEQGTRPREYQKNLRLKWINKIIRDLKRYQRE